MSQNNAQSAEKSEYSATRSPHHRATGRPKNSQGRPSRRRGKALEDAILSVAWDQLNTIGYEKLTIQDVAKLAGTNKATLYRRWPNKVELVAAAFRQFGSHPDIIVPNTGNLREDLRALLDQIQKALAQLTTGKMTGLMADRIKELDTGQIFGALNGSTMLTQMLNTILEQAESRGELTTATIPERVLELPLLLLLNEAISKGSLDDTAISEIVDQILMPLLTQKKQN
ncbi:TetR/AcrR family transcriptional regulator [Furfurilactobacillus curtus]|uniref:AcrR family transcriptional regulator n=1 Tax=Furfurilactobacillus curtus TaxID=1746200 RepID=A0ABQ5JSP3_9LACO